MPILDRFRNVWNAFMSRPVTSEAYDYMASTAYVGPSPSRSTRRYSNERSIISSIYTRLSIDVSGILIKHIKLDNEGRYIKDMESALNDCLTLEPNLDQGPRAFRQDIALTLFDKGVAVIVPVETSVNPENGEPFDIYKLRVGEVVSWRPKHIRVSVYNEETGKRQEITLAKRYLSVVENPLYSVMNETNSTLQRLIRKLTLLDTVDEQASSGKLDIIIQLPYVIKSEARRQQAVARREDIEFQLKGSQYGIAYIDGTEKITQLNRPAENNLLKQIEFLTGTLYNQLGLTEDIMNGTADEATMLNYYNRTVEPIVDAIIEAMQKGLLTDRETKKAERIRAFRDPFKFVPVTQIAEIADKFTRNEIMTSNEIRSYMGIPPSSDPKADLLVNSNMPQPNPAVVEPVSTNGADVNIALDEIESTLDHVFNGLGGK